MKTKSNYMTSLDKFIDKKIRKIGTSSQRAIWKWIRYFWTRSSYSTSSWKKGL